jgi:hypothetical protein
MASMSSRTVAWFFGDEWRVASKAGARSSWGHAFVFVEDKAVDGDGEPDRKVHAEYVRKWAPTARVEDLAA